MATINFRLVRYLWLFLAVAEEKHFGRAAERLGMSQPPLTTQIQALEEALRAKLFDRSRRGVQLTPFGMAILPAVRKWADQMERLELAVQEAVSGRSGILTIGAITSAMVDVLPPVIERMKADYPELTLSVREIDSVDAIPALEAGDLDLALARLDGQLGANIKSISLLQDRMVVALPREHRLAKQAHIRLASLAEESFIMFSRRVSPVSFDSVVSSCQARGFSPRIVHEVRSAISQVAFVGCGQGIALVPFRLKRFCADNVVLRPLKEKLDILTTAVAWSTVRETPLVLAVVNALKDVKVTSRL